MASPYIEIPVGDRLVKVSNPDKVYFPEHGYTKRQLVEYYIAVGEGILRATRDRPTTLERWPAGVFEGAKMATREDYARSQMGAGGGKSDAFYQKRIPKGAPGWV
ncbi:ATP-dependent DNA ligase, partial [Actinomadura adrarensis]